MVGPGNVWRKFSVVDLRAVLLVSTPHAILVLLYRECMGGMSTGGCLRVEGSTWQKLCHNNDFYQEASQEECYLQESPGKQKIGKKQTHALSKSTRFSWIFS